MDDKDNFTKEDFKDITPEQNKEIRKVLFKAQMSLLWVSSKMYFFIFLANLICILLGKFLFVDSDPSTIVGFQIICLAANLFLIIGHYKPQFSQVSDIAKGRVKEILKK